MTTSPGPLDRWYEAAGVRGGVRRIFHAEAEQGRVFFPEALVPHLDHPEVRALPPERIRELTVRHLYQFLHATTHLETRVVNGAAEPVANGRVGMDFSAALRMDAFKVYCDEGYHALYSLDLADQVAHVTGIAVPDVDYGGFVTALQAAGRALLPDDPLLAGQLQAVVFETLITAVLNEVPQDPTVVSTVRELMRDHAKDEGRHHRFFSAFFLQLWGRLDQRRRIAAGRALPAMIRAALDWDLGPVHTSLRLAGLGEDQARAVLADAYGETAVTARIQTVSRATVRLAAQAGAFELPGVPDAFAAHGLREPEDHDD
ncbi:diiron oxygenase [Streptomyces sp. MP131-18]|uniref:diiron oxygenase n=1 Tax=Streptomyces sp. MP131-18 TaxID=1857892 RepID=UPI00097C94A6|nr:diiron oxygenase [Streptomyces sp. MP131-18]ONK14144.1 P-aminobenzoate N-oxygenase AurF [Streptomyces sp. MP131-18]